MSAFDKIWALEFLIRVRCMRIKWWFVNTHLKMVAWIVERLMAYLSWLQRRL